MIVIYQMLVYWQLILLLLLLPDVRSWTSVTDCPYSEDEWRNRSISYNCHSGGFKYHCLKTTSGHLVENCHPRRGMNEKDGCPTFDFRNASYRIIQTRCTGPQQGCPHQNETFFSYEVYKFPSCLPPRLDRAMSVRPDTETPMLDYRETTVGTELTTQFHQTNPTLHVQYSTTNDDFPLTTTKQISEVSFIDQNLLYFVTGGIGVASIIVGFICLVLIQCKRIKQFKLQMERANYMSSVPYNSHASHIYHQDTDIYDYVDETDMKDDDKNFLESNELRQKRDVDDESSSEAYVEPNRPSIESMERNEIFDINTQMKNAPLSCNIIRQDTYLEPKVGLLTDRRDNVDVIESDGSMPSQNQRVCVKLTRLVSNDSYVEPSLRLHPSCQEDVECNVKEESSSVISNTNITEDEIVQNSESEELNLQDLNSDVHYDDASSCINTSYKELSNPSETVSDLNISDKVENCQTESILNIPVRRNENVVISQEPVETRSSQLEPIRDGDYIDPI